MFCFSSAFLRPLRSDEKQITDSHVDFGAALASVWSQLLHTGRCAMVRPRARSPALRQRTDKKGRFLSLFRPGFVFPAQRRSAPALPAVCPRYHCRTFAARLPRSSPVRRIVFAALKPVKRSLHAPARNSTENDGERSQILKRRELHTAVNNSRCFLACQCLLIVERTEDHNESAEIFDLQRVQFLDCCPQLLRGKIRSG